MDVALRYFTVTFAWPSLKFLIRAISTSKLTLTLTLTLIFFGIAP